MQNIAPCLTVLLKEDFWVRKASHNIGRARHCFQKYLICIISNSSHHWKIGVVIIILILWVKKWIKVIACAILQTVLAPKSVSRTCILSPHTFPPSWWDRHWLRPGPSMTTLPPSPALSCCLCTPCLGSQATWHENPFSPSLCCSRKSWTSVEEPQPTSKQLSGCQRAGWSVCFYQGSWQSWAGLATASAMSRISMKAFTQPIVGVYDLGALPWKLGRRVNIAGLGPSCQPLPPASSD